MAGKQILLVDDEKTVADAVRLLLHLDKHDVDYVGDGFSALEKYQGHTYDLVITDSRMPEMTGLQLARRIRRHKPDQRIMMLTGFPPSDPTDDVDLVMLKPFSATELRSAVTRLTDALTRAPT